MKRKAKIGMAAALALAGAAVVGFLWARDPGELRVSYVGFMPGNSHYAVFVITNASHETFRYTTARTLLTNRPAEIPKRSFQTNEISPPTSAGILAPNTHTTFTMRVWYPARWSSVVLYEPYPVPAFYAGARQRLATWAQSHNWSRVAGWLQPKPVFKAIYGPEMLDNKPMADEEK